MKQNRVIKRLAKLEKERKQIVQPEKKKIEVIDDTPDRENLNNNVSPIKENVVIDINKPTEQENKVVDTSSQESVTKDPFKLPLPADYEDYWYEADDGCWYNEYDDELEEGYYYASEATMDQTNASNTKASTISVDTQSKSMQKGLPKPSDYEDYWYEGEDGMWYNEYDDELEEGQFYEDSNANDASSAAEEAKKKEEEAKKAAESKRIAEEEAKKAQEEAARVAREASKAAEDAAKAAKEASQNLMKGFSSMGGSMFGATKPDAKKPEAKKSTGFGFGGMFGSSEPTKKPQPKPTQQKPQTTQQKLPAAQPKQQQTQQKPSSQDKAQPGLQKSQQQQLQKQQATQQKQQSNDVSQQKQLSAKDVSDVKKQLPAKDTPDSISKKESTATIQAQDKSAQVLKKEECKQDVVVAQSVLESRRTEGMTPKERWQWSYGLVEKVT